MTNNPLMMTIDFGTQSVRVALISHTGNIVAIEKKSYNPTYISSSGGFIEQNPYYYFECMCECSKKLLSVHGDKKKDIVGLSLDTFRDSIVIADKDFNVLRPCILWLDERQAALKEKLPFLHRLIFKVIGMEETIRLNRKRTPAHWIKENEPKIWAKTDKYMNISTYFNYLLTDEYKDSPANQAGHLPIDFKRNRWQKEGALKARIFGIPHRMLCELIPVGGVIGFVSNKASKLTGIPEGLKLFATGSDKACETLGLGAIEPGIAAISYGTASTIEITTEKYYDSEPFLPSYPSVVNGYYNMEVQVYRGYWMLKWFKEEFANETDLDGNVIKVMTLDVLNQKMSNIPPGSEGLVLLPYWGPGLRRPLAKGAIMGFSHVHTKIHLYRAIIEGIAYALREALLGFEKKTKTKVKEIRVAGGGSKSETICQITADIFGLPVLRSETYETSSIGGAMAGFVAAKVFSSIQEASNSMVRTDSRYEPNEENYKKYDYLFKHAYIKMYPSLKDIYYDLNSKNK